MRKDTILKVVSDSPYSEEALLVNGVTSVWIYKQNLVDEHGGNLSWYFHPVFKKLTHVYYDSERDVFWLPKDKLYNKKALKARIKDKNYAFFKYDYAEAVLRGESTTDKGQMTGFLPAGESL